MRVIVVGAGFSGLLATIHLLRHPGVEVVLIERGAVFGVGPAYSTDNPDHLLNVRAGNMSAFPEDPGHFVLWLARRGQTYGAEAFVSRAIYGEYLKSLLGELLATPDTSYRLRLLNGEASDLREDSGWQMTVAGSGSLQSDAVVLALGNDEPTTPTGLVNLTKSPRYFNDPWRGLAGVPDAASRILLLGTGLTMVDAALSLRRPRRTMIAISRRGLLPHAHAPHEAIDALHHRGSPVGLLRQARAMTREADWRAVMDELRPQTRAMWRSWSVPQRARALRHLRPYWDIHRHRLAPQIASRVTEMRGTGELFVHSGKVVEAKVVDEHVRVTWRGRGSHTVSPLNVDAVINCTGPGSHIQQSHQPLLRGLLGSGRIMADPNGLGAVVDEANRLLDLSGNPATGLYAMGSMTRGSFWEITAVPELRLQAKEVAAAILAQKKPA